MRLRILTLGFFLITINSFLNIFAQQNHTSVFEQGKVLLEKGDSTQALKLFTESIKANKDTESLFIAAMILKNGKTLGELQKAKKYFLDAIDKDENNIHYRFQLGLLLEHIKKVARDDIISLHEAMNQYREIIKIDSTYSPAYFRLGKEKTDEYFEMNRSLQKTDGTPVIHYSEHSAKARNKLLKEQWERQLN